MMFSMDKCSGRCETETSEESELFAGGGEGLGKENVASDEVASAVAAVSDEIGDILKDELADGDRVDRIGAELADLSAELGLLAGLADEPQQDFPSLFEIAMGHRGSGSGSSSSSWSGARGRPRRPTRPARAPRARAIAKGKELVVRRSVGARRAVFVRARRASIVSDASDVGADEDSDDQWTELDDACSSDSSSSLKETAGAGVIECNGYQKDSCPQAASPPAMGQFLLPLLSGDSAAPDPEHFLIRHEDILQLLASAEESVREEITLDEDNALAQTADMLSPGAMFPSEEPAVTPDEQAALLHYVCEAERFGSQWQGFAPVEEWLLGVYHSWCEISALMYTLIGTNMSVEMVTSEWVYRARFGCHCRLCLCLANNSASVAALVRNVVWALAHENGCGRIAALVVRFLGTAPEPNVWDLPRLRRALDDPQGATAAVIHEQLVRLSRHNDISGQIVEKICLCRQYDKPMEKQYAVERFCKILENFKAASTITFKVELVPTGGTEAEWVHRARSRLARCLAPHQRASTSARLRDMAARTTPHDLSAWSGYKHRCDCLTPRTLCAQQRKQLLRISFFGMMQAVNEFNGAKPDANGAGDKPPNEPQPEANRQLQQGDGTGAKPPDVVEGQPAMDTTSYPQPMDTSSDHFSDGSGDLDDLTDSDASGTASLGLSTSSSLDSASELLLAAAAAVESGGEDGEAAPGELCRTVRHLMRSIASIERLMDQVLKHCDDWPAPPRSDHEARKRVDMGLSEVDRKLMAMYRRLPEVHRRQLQVYRKQQKLSTVCMQLVGGTAPAPPPPGSPPPPPAPQPPRALCPEYHLQRFKEVRRKVMHMRDQQLYYHRLRMWLEDQLRHERESLPESNVTLIEDLPRRKRRNVSPKVPRLQTAPKRKLKPVSPSISKPHKILQMLKHKVPERERDDEVEPPEAFPLEREDNISDTETIVGEIDVCKEMKECFAKFANFALHSPSDAQEFEIDGVKYPESESPPLQEMSPTTSEPMPVYTPKGNQRILAVNKFLNRSDDKVLDFQSQASEINIPLNARRTPILVKEETDEDVKITEVTDTVAEKDPNVYKYVTFGLEIKKAMEECQNIINSYNCIKDKSKEESQDGPLSLEQICEVMMSLDKSSADFLGTVDADDSLDASTANSKLTELVENMPQILANMPEIASKLSEFANASFELPEFATIMNSLPDVNNEAQLTPETLKQIRELKLNKCKDYVKVTKNTTKRKANRRIKNNSDSSDFIGTMTFEFDSRDITELLKDEKELQALMKNKSSNKEDFKDLLFSISAQVVINKVFEYLKQSKSPELAKCLEDDKNLFSLPKNSINSDMYSKASTLFDNSVKDAFSMDELRDLVKSRFISWKHYVLSKFKGMPVEILENEIEAMLDKFYSYIQDLAGKQCANDSDKIIEKIDELRKNSDLGKDSDSDSTSKESLKQISKFLSTSPCNTFDLLIMKLSKMSQDKKSSVKSLKFKYMDVLKRCHESQQLAAWILADPEIASNVIKELTGLPTRKIDKVPDFSTMSNDRKKDYFIDNLRDMNRLYMETLPKKILTGDEWLVMLYRLEQLESKLKESFSKVSPPTKVQTASEAEILAAKGLSKIIGKANVRVVKKTDPPKPSEKAKKEDKPKEEKVGELTKEEQEKKSKNDALLAKCEAILTSKGEKSLLDSFYTIKSYITQGLPVPETYKKHVISICSSIDAKLLDEEIEETLKCEKEQENLDFETIREKKSLAVIGSQNPEMLAKYSAQALRNAKQTLNAVAFRNMMRNGQTKSESDACDTPKTDCKWTNDCLCSSCKANDNSVCLGDIVKQCYDIDKSKVVEDKKKEVKKVPPKQVKPQAKCDNTSHQTHVCKVGHTGNGGACAGEAGADQPCSCCYCTVFGHAPPLTTPVPRNFNETRERLRSILNKKKQQCKTTNGEPEALEKRQAGVQTQTPDPQPKIAKPAAVTPKPPALPRSLPPRLPASQSPARLQRRQALDAQQRALAERMASMAVTDKPKALKRSVPTQVEAAPTIKTEGKVNPSAMEQIRLQHLKQHQQAQLQQRQMHQQQLQQQQLQQQQLQQQQQQQAQQKAAQQQAAQQQAAQQQAAQQQQQAQQKKPEPIYDLPIHNKPPLTPQLHQQMLQQQQRQSRAQQQRAMSLSSRDTSVFSTSSGCSDGSCWRGHEDTRDLDALLQYIEGPARHVDRGKKRAKKQRQKAKKLESRLSEQRVSLCAELSRARRAAEGLHAAHATAQRRLNDLRATATQHKTNKKGKKQKLTAAQQAQMQHVNEQLEELTAIMNTAAKEMQAADKQVLECSKRLQHCERQLQEVRSIHSGDGGSQQQERAAIQQQKYQQQQIEQHRHMLELDKQKMDKQKQNAFIAANPNSIVCVKRSPGDGAVTVTIPGQSADTLATLMQNSSLNPAPPVEPRKQSWEQALAHINQLAKGGKDKKKLKEKEQQKAEAKAKEKELQRSNSAPETQTLSKKQRRLLAKQQAEEEEKKRQQQLQQEAKKKESKKQEAAKNETNKKVDKKSEIIKKDTNKVETNKKVEPKKVEPKKVEPKKVEPKKVEPKKVETKKSETKKVENNKKIEKKETKPLEKKQEKVEKTAPSGQSKQAKPAQQQQNKRDNKKKEQQPQPQPQSHKPQVINITPDTTIEVVDKRKPCSTEVDKPTTCSIMEQLSCGVQVADLKLPPGITLTRVQPNEKKDPPAIKSLPVWKCSQLAAPPTAPVRPPPVINADPNMMMFTTSLPEPPKSVLIPEQPPPSQPTGKSKKSKKKAKKAAAETTAEPKQEPKMVTLRNPMFHPTLPPVQVTNTPPKKAEIRIPDPIPMPPNACQATITPTSNGMYTIRNPLMSLMHQQNIMGSRNPTPQLNMYGQPFNYVNPNPYTPVQNQYAMEPKDELQNRLINLASFTQKNDEGYSLFKTNDDTSQKTFLSPEFYEPVVSPNPIGTRPSDCNRSFDSNDSSLFANPIHRPEPIGTPLKHETEYTGLYTPFGQEDRNVFRHALFNDRSDVGSNVGVCDDVGASMTNGDLPYFQRLRVGAKLNNEVTVHHVTESKFYKGQDGWAPVEERRGAWSGPLDSTNNSCLNNNLAGGVSVRGSPTGSSVCSGASGASPPNTDTRFGPVGARHTNNGNTAGTAYAS